jgi:putative tryptophan/tyrosine transport system substrate-binding protein
MRRREFVAGIGSLPLCTLGARGQAAKRPLIAVVIGSSATSSSRYLDGFLQGMQDLGYREGRDVDFVYRYADGDMGRLPALASELVLLGPNVVVCGNTAGIFAVKQATTTIPIVGSALTDPVGLGLAAIDARPGGQVTGVLITLDTLTGKQLGLALEVIPRASRIGVLGTVDNPIKAIIRRNAESAAAGLSVNLVPIDIRSPDDLDEAFQKFLNEGVEIVLVLQESALLNARRRIAALAASARLPSLYSFREHVDDGGLISYGTNLRESYRRSANYVHRILGGAKPGDLPIELPTRLELVVNLKTAKVLGLAISESFLLRADAVIE